jgi:hypothetical protein
MAEYSTFLSLLFSTHLLLLFLSIPLPPLAFVCAHSSTLPFPLLFAIVFQLHSLHSYCCEFPKLRKHTQLLATNTNCFQQPCFFFLSLNILPVTFIFSCAHYILINT